MYNTLMYHVLSSLLDNAFVTMKENIGPMWLNKIEDILSTYTKSVVKSPPEGQKSQVTSQKM